MRPIAIVFWGFLSLLMPEQLKIRLRWPYRVKFLILRGQSAERAVIIGGFAGEGQTYFDAFRDCWNQHMRFWKNEAKI